MLHRVISDQAWGIETSDMNPDNKGTELGKRFNEGKLRWDLLPYTALEQIVRIYTFGATKYGDWNWYKGLKFSNSFTSGMRHRVAWWNGERNDPESGLHHLAHAAWNDIANLTFELENRTSLDDRIIKAVKV